MPHPGLRSPPPSSAAMAWSRTWFMTGRPAAASRCSVPLSGNVAVYQRPVVMATPCMPKNVTEPT